MVVNIYYLELLFTLVNVLQQQKLMRKDILIEILFLRKKDKRHQKKLVCKFIRINTSNAKNGYDIHYEVGNVQAFIDEFKNKKVKKIRKAINKRKRNEREIRKRNERNKK